MFLPHGFWLITLFSSSKLCFLIKLQRQLNPKVKVVLFFLCTSSLTSEPFMVLLHVPLDDSDSFCYISYISGSMRPLISLFLTWTTRTKKEDVLC